MSNEQGHSWMTPGMPLAKEHLLSQYYTASETNNSDTIVEGVIYVETDVRYETPASAGELSTWAAGPVNEIKFLRAIVEVEYGERESQMLKGIVAWAPMDQSPETLKAWLALVEQTAGPTTWKRVKGFRFLLQAIHDRNTFEKLVGSGDFVENLQILGRRGFSFDIGVDQNSGGIWQLEAISQTIAQAHRGVAPKEKTVFVLNHLCKPNFASQGPEFQQWHSAVESLSKHSRTYTKLSGAFSELPEGLASVEDVVAHLRPWVEHVFRMFGPERIMFGSDWPVCNLKGPRGEASWGAWKEVVEAVLAEGELRLSAGDKERIWSGTALQAYGVSSEMTD